MEKIVFDGQQTDERILAEIRPHHLNEQVSILLSAALIAFFTFVLFGISTVVPPFSGLIRSASAIGAVSTGILVIWWIHVRENRTVTYITDRRIMRIMPATPLFMSKRSLFWNEVLKAKAYAPNMLYRIVNIGNVTIEPHLSEHENITLDNVYLFEDVANYIDKILFTFKNRPQDIAGMKPFVSKPKGKRD